jgi:hypothetical protein
MYSYIYSEILIVCFQETFPDPKGLSDELHSKGFKGIWMLDPGIHAEKGYKAYDTGCEEDVWVHTADGKPYIGKYLLMTLCLLNFFDSVSLELLSYGCEIVKSCTIYAVCVSLTLLLPVLHL